MNLPVPLLKDLTKHISDGYKTVESNTTLSELLENSRLLNRLLCIHSDLLDKDPAFHSFKCVHDLIKTCSKHLKTGKCAVELGINMAHFETTVEWFLDKIMFDDDKHLFTEKFLVDSSDLWKHERQFLKDLVQFVLYLRVKIEEAIHSNACENCCCCGKPL